MRWPRKNDAALDPDAPGGGGRQRPRHVDRPRAVRAAAEALTGVAVIPVSVVPDRDRARRVRARATPATSSRPAARPRRCTCRSRTPKAGSPLSMTRGATAAGTIRTYVLADRITRASCFVCARRGRRDRARALDRGARCRRCGSGSRRPTTRRSRSARGCARSKTHVVGPMCHVLWRWTTGDAVGPNMMTRNSYALNMGVRDGARAREAGARDPRGEHGRRQEAVARVLPVGPRQDRARRGVPRRRADPARPAHDRRQTSRRSRGRARTARSRAACSRSRSPPPPRSPRSSPPPGQDLGMVGTSSMAHGTARRVDGGLQATIRFGGPRGRHRRRRHDAPVGARLARVDRLRRRRQGLPLRADRRGRRALRSRSAPRAAMATAGSENFFRAHHERGGLRDD